MNLYTSYYAQIRNFPKNLVGLSTAKYPPKWRPLGQDKNGIWVIDCPPLKPGIECAGLCNGKCNLKRPDCSFLQTYRKQLDNIDINKFLNNLFRLKKKIEVEENLNQVSFAFIVFEAPTNPCSERWPIQDWLRANNIKIEEWSKNEK